MSKDTSNAVTIRQDSDVDLVTFSEERIALIRKKLAPNAPDLEFDYWIAKCQKRGLNPLIGQSYLVPRKSGGQTNWVEQTGMPAVMSRSLWRPTRKRQLVRRDPARRR
jgi:hypothetical protein